METLLNKLEEAQNMRGILRVNQIDCPLTREEIETIISLLKGGWISVKERLPDSCRNVLCYYEHDGVFEARRHDMSVTYFVTTENDHDGEGDYFASATVTHWRELPPKPTE